MKQHNYFISYKGFDKDGVQKLEGSTTFSRGNKLFNFAEIKSIILETCIAEDKKHLDILPVCVSYLGVSNHA